MPSLVEYIDDLYKNTIPYEGLYAQGVALYREGFRYWFTDEEMKLLNNHNREFEEPNIERELILSRFRLPKGNENGVFMSNAEIMEHIGTMIKYTLSKTKINRAMHELGYETIRKKNERGFCLMLLTPEEIAAYKSVGKQDSYTKEPKLPL